MSGRDFSAIRYLVEFIPVENHELVKADSWIVEGLTLAEIDWVCKGHPARASLYELEDVARVRRLVILAPAGLGMNEVNQLQRMERERVKRESRPTAWDHILRDEV